MGSCDNTDMKKQYIGRHDEAARMLSSAVIKGKHGGDYVIGAFGKVEELKEQELKGTGDTQQEGSKLCSARLPHPSRQPEQ